MISVRRTKMLQQALLDGLDEGCMFPLHAALSGYAAGCRCDRCSFAQAQRRRRGGRPACSPAWQPYCSCVEYRPQVFTLWGGRQERPPEAGELCQCAVCAKPYRPTEGGDHDVQQSRTADSALRLL